MILSTTFDIPGSVVSKILGVVTANQVLGNDFISENIASITDIFGGKSGVYRSKLDMLIDNVKKQMKEKASSMNADAIIGFSISTNQISSKGMSMFMITATGTAVRLKPDRYALLEKLHKIAIYHEEGFLSDEEYMYESSRIKKTMSNDIALEAKADLERRQFEEALESKRLQEIEEAKRKYAEEHADELKAVEEARRKFEKENADNIRAKAEILEFIKNEFSKHKNELKMLDLDTVPNANYKSYLPAIPGLSHSDIMKYMVSIGQIAEACKFYCDNYFQTPSDAKRFLLYLMG